MLVNGARWHFNRRTPRIGIKCNKQTKKKWLRSQISNYRAKASINGDRWIRLVRSQMYKLLRAYLRSALTSVRANQRLDLRLDREREMLASGQTAIRNRLSIWDGKRKKDRSIGETKETKVSKIDTPTRIGGYGKKKRKNKKSIFRHLRKIARIVIQLINTRYIFERKKKIDTRITSLIDPVESRWIDTWFIESLAGIVRGRMESRSRFPALSKATSCFHRDPGNLTYPTKASFCLKLLHGRDNRKRDERENAERRKNIK